MGEPAYDRLKQVVDEVRGERLSGFLQEVSSAAGLEVEPSDGRPGELRLPLLSEYRCLIFTTRLWGWYREELEDIQEFCRQGGSVLIMSNHPPYNRRDNALAKVFGFSFSEPAYPWHGGSFGVTRLMEEHLAEHSITGGLDEGVVFNNCCGVRVEDEGEATHRVLARLPEEPPPANVFALAMEAPLGEGAGRVVGIGDSGFIGASGTGWPGPGQFDEGDNRLFMANAIRWLCRQT